jgi:hypothetical protein
MGSGCSRSENAQSLDKKIFQNKLKFSSQFRNLQFSNAEHINCATAMEQDQ